MIYLSHIKFAEPIVFDDKNNVLVIENPNEFASLISELTRQAETDDGNFTLFDEKQKEYKLSAYADIMIDFISFSVNDKKIINAVYKRLQSDFMARGNYGAFAEVNEKVFQLLDEIIVNSEFDLTYDEADFPGLMKLYGVQFNEEYDSLIEKIVAYFDALKILRQVKIIVLVNARSYFSESDIEALYKHFDYQKINVLTIESRIPEKILPCEEVRVIDRDLCEFIYKS